MTLLWMVARPTIEEDIIDPTFPDIMGFDDEAMPESDAMMSALIAAGTSPEAASNFVHRVIGEKNATTFMEMYGQGSLVAEANKQRRSLNVEGLRAFDLRTNKPDGSPWNFNVRADRKLAREMIHADEPEWIIGSPPCTAFCIWNRQMNYRKMPVEKVRQAIAEGERHWNFCCSLYRRQLALGRHFLHEHPARALSWKHPQIASISRMAGVHLVTADQCAYGLTTPSQVDGTPAPAMKPTKFLTSSIFMAKRLQARCDRSHVHQQLTGGRCKDAAYYPLPLIRAILRGIHDTSVAGEKLVEERAELIKTLNALGNQPMTLTSPHFVKPNSGEDCDKEMVKKSKIKKTNGGYLNINYDCWKPRYVDEYTGEVLQDNLIHDAMIDELDYFNEHV